MSRINLPTHPLDPSRKLMYGNVPVAKLTRREALELLGLIAREQIEQVQDLGLNWRSPYRMSLRVTDWQFAMQQAQNAPALTEPPTRESTCATGEPNEPQN